MKLLTLSTTILALLLTLAASASAATDFQNAIKCGKNFSKVNQAIEKFCSKKNKNGKIANDLVVPSKYANEGVTTWGIQGNGIKVKISGNCTPAQWIPHKWCMAQFHALCAELVVGCLNFEKYGKGGCQTFEITIMKPQTGAYRGSCTPRI